MLHGVWNYAVPMPGHGLAFGPWMMILVAVLVVSAVVYLLRTFGRDSLAADQEKQPLDILKERFARGEIDHADYESRKRVLSGS